MQPTGESTECPQCGVHFGIVAVLADQWEMLALQPKLQIETVGGSQGAWDNTWAFCSEYRRGQR